jgi:signal transduction histidine kinase
MKDDHAAKAQNTEALLAENRELRLQLQQAMEANAAKETFLSNMSHDIRTPMNAIVGMTALARRYIDEKSRVIDALDKIVDEYTEEEMADAA